MQLIEGRKIYLFEFVDCSNSMAGKTNWKLKPGHTFSGSCTVEIRAVGDGLPELTFVQEALSSVCC